MDLVDPAAECVDSPMMTKRLRSGRSISAEIAGRRGDYRTQVRTALIETIAKVVLAFPETLGLFGIAGFDENDNDDEGGAD